MGLLDRVAWVDLPSIKDERGVLTAIESGVDIPFEIRRVFFMHHITSERGGHAHRDTSQVLMAVAGSFTLELFDGEKTRTYQMSDPTKGIFMPPMVFVRHYDFSSDAVCLVLADTHYDMARSIRSKEAYLEVVGRQ
ncbi:sugar 3,4-ketoisomerase [Pseudodesulfovibrio pelocollis]|uniref:sugar 3,4-ketoisomerase n=1 Tax=Pseudodesulfovibrio pelocollis TaxID=3051432 RepID=UPI00255B2653|nr:FdtA/QdtA family cupin domain-containing protein [Pseudodesulfovibrio sp. SB368]